MLFGNRSHRQNETCTTAFLRKLVSACRAHKTCKMTLLWQKYRLPWIFPGLGPWHLCCWPSFCDVTSCSWTRGHKRLSPMITPGEKAAQTVWLASTTVKEFLQFHVLVLRNSLARHMPQKQAKEQHYLFPPQIFIAPQWHARRGLSMPAFLFLLLVVCYGLMIKSLHFSYLYPSYITKSNTYQANISDYIKKCETKQLG